MSNLEKLIQAFETATEIPAEQINDELSYGVDGWDSVAHMGLVAEIELAFDIMMDADDVIAMSSFRIAKEILNKYDVDF
jgi:acyl carrier protein